MRAKLHDLCLSRDGGYLLTVATREDARELFDTLKDADVEIVIKKRGKKRSLDANAYCWQLLDKLALALGSTKEELYRLYIKRVGIFKDFTLTENEAKTFRVAWGMLGTGWLTEQVDYAPDGERVVIRAYYGSHVYDTQRMARLIDEIVQDCKEIGIQTLTGRELSLMKERWPRGK